MPEFIRLEVQHQLASFSLDVALEIPISGITVLFGHSGAGKSLLLRILAGLEPHITSQLSYGDTILQSATRFVPAHRRQIGMVFQEPQLFKHLTVADNLAFASRYARLPLSASAQQQIIERLELTALLARRPTKLSGGERQRVALARALFSSPKLLLLDEPFAALDEVMTRNLLTFLAELSLPLIYVSHSLAEVLQLADYLIQIENGYLLKAGTLNQVLNTIGRPGIVLNGVWLSHQQGISHYQTSLCRVEIAGLRNPSTARVFIAEHNLRLLAPYIPAEASLAHQSENYHDEVNHFSAKITAIHSDVNYGYLVQIVHNGTSIQVRVNSMQYNALGLAVDQYAIIQVRQAELL